MYNKNNKGIIVFEIYYQLVIIFYIQKINFYFIKNTLDS